MTDQCILTVTCSSARGQIASIAGFLDEHRSYINELAQFDDTTSNRFFLRCRFRVEAGVTPPLPDLRRLFGEGLAVRYRMDWAIHDAAARPDPRLALRPLPQRPPLPAPDRRAAHGGYRRRLQPPGSGAARHPSRHPLRPPADLAREQAGAGGPAPGADRGDGQRAGRAGALHAGPLGRAVCAAGRLGGWAAGRLGGWAAGRLGGWAAGRSTSITRSCPASRVRGPIIGRTSVA